MASSPDASDKQSPHQIIELQHFSHQHLLLYRDLTDVDKKYNKCDMCYKWISIGDGYFSCKECYDFFLHKSCAELPRYIHNFLHPLHTLELFKLEKDEDYKFCRSCPRSISYLGYKCRYSTIGCNFNLHIKCATKNIFDPKDHQHLFILLKPTLFTCDACGIHKDTKYLSYICSICQLQVHANLACHEKFPLSGRVLQRMHAHVLKLCYSFQIGFDFSNKSCKICSKKMNNVLCLYQCNNKACASYIAHVSCATSEDYWIENIDHEEEEEVELEEIDTEPEEVIKHFSHPHSLILSNIEPTYEAGYVCHGCVRPIISAPFYTCHSQKCTFFLHKQCSQLPTTIQSPIHQHLLTLDLDVDDTVIGGFTCGACKVRCNGFAYECTTKGYYCSGKKFDIECTLLGDTLNHASHEHTLTLVSTIPNEENRCIACGSTFSIAFWCEECNYFLDLNCAALPITIRHDCPTGTEWTVKPLKLTYNCIEHAGGQYYCDLCAETRGKDLWFYHCEDCRDSIHPECLLGDARFMYGKSYNINGHCHTVCVTKKPKTDPLCDTCGKPCQHSPLVFCPTCKVYFHDNFECCGMSSSSRDKPIRDFCCRVPSCPNDDDDDEEEDAEIVVEPVNHFGHPHNLIIGDEYDPKRLDREVCDGCGMQISDPFYRCGDKKGKCNFFLHKECFELPKQIQHPLHPDHPLVLNSFLDLPCNGEVGFICYRCDAFSNCFVYTCLACKFFLDVRCSLLSDTLVHKSHPCTLTLIDKKKELTKVERKCQACNSDCSSCKYICDECNFNLGLRCASLPKVAMHECSDDEDNPQHLVYEDASRYKYCDRCEEPIGEKGWYYYCKDCGESTHVGCSDAGSPNLMKNGIVYQAYNHFHNLITITITDSKFLCCDVCGEGMKESPAVYCEKCDVYFHVKCCRWLPRV